MKWNGAELKADNDNVGLEPYGDLEKARSEFGKFVLVSLKEIGDYKYALSHMGIPDTIADRLMGTCSTAERRIQDIKSKAVMSKGADDIRIGLTHLRPMMDKLRRALPGNVFIFVSNMERRAQSGTEEIKFNAVVTELGSEVMAGLDALKERFEGLDEFSQRRIENMLEASDSVKGLDKRVRVAVALLRGLAARHERPDEWSELHDTKKWNRTVKRTEKLLVEVRRVNGEIEKSRRVGQK